MTNPEDEDQQHSHKETFERDGFLLLKQVLDKDLLAEWQQFASQHFPQCFQDLHQKGHTEFPSHCEQHDNDTSSKKYALGLGIKHGFREIVMRSPGRYELSLLNCRDQAPSIEALKAELAPFVPHLLGGGSWDDNDTTNDNSISLCHLSLVVSTPGALEQSWHADGGHVSVSEHLPCHVLNVFLPLRDISPELGPTEFRPGSHVYTRNLAPMLLAAKCRKELRSPVAPCLDEGDALIFDYRVLHRGKANRSVDQDRPFLVLTFAKSWYKDVCNFPTRSLYDAPSTTTSISS